MTLSQSQNHLLLSSYQSKIGFLFDMQNINDFKSDCVKIINNMLFGTIENFIGG